MVGSRFSLVRMLMTSWGRHPWTSGRAVAQPASSVATYRHSRRLLPLPDQLAPQFVRQDCELSPGLFASLAMCCVLRQIRIAQPWQLLLTQGLLYSIGGSMAYYPTFDYLQEWFHERRGFANGVCFAGESPIPLSGAKLRSGSHPDSLPKQALPPAVSSCRSSKKRFSRVSALNGLSSRLSVSRFPPCATANTNFSSRRPSLSRSFSPPLCL